MRQWQDECDAVKARKEAAAAAKAKAEADYSNARTQQEAERAEKAIKEAAVALKVRECVHIVSVVAWLLMLHPVKADIPFNAVLVCYCLVGGGGGGGGGPLPRMHALMAVSRVATWHACSHRVAMPAALSISCVS